MKSAIQPIGFIFPHTERQAFSIDPSSIRKSSTLKMIARYAGEKRFGVIDPKFDEHHIPIAFHVSWIADEEAQELAQTTKEEILLEAFRPKTPTEINDLIKSLADDCINRKQIYCNLKSN